jgi:uncharacterized repeat protein (TIGR03803 family)
VDLQTDVDDAGACGGSRIFSTITVLIKGSGSGTVFQISGSTHQALTTLTAFNGNGAAPEAGIVADGAGNLYGTTSSGGTSNDGTVFELSGINHTVLTTLVNFSGSNGLSPVGSLLIDSKANLYGTTSYGGAPGGATGHGTVFDLSGSSHTVVTSLWIFNGSNGDDVEAGLSMDSSGNLYGTTKGGGAGFGTVFELSSSNGFALNTLASFTSATGTTPESGVIADANGNLFGTTYSGGAFGRGTVYELSGPNHQTLNTIVSFDGTNGSLPAAGLTSDASGDLFGTTTAYYDSVNNVAEDGTVFELSGTGFAVPEPSAFALIAASGLAICRRRRARTACLPTMIDWDR